MAPDRCCVFTIVSRNYFHFALTLMASVAQHLPGTRRVIVVCDALDGLPALEGIELLPYAELPLPQPDRMALHYTILELNTAIKPFAFRKLLDADVDAVVYFDPDIRLYGSGAPLLERLADAQVVLTPHLTAPLADDHHPSDLSIVQSGTYNLGFLALRKSEDTASLVDWWGAKLVRDCVVDIPRGLFTDQKWMDLVPGLVPRVAIERDPGWNVAYWNLAHREVTPGADGYRVNGRPLFFFHYSGRDPKSASISKHQDRFTLERCSPAVRELFASYEAELAQQGRERFAALPYAFATLGDGTPLPDIARPVLREQLRADAPLPDLRSAAGAQAVIGFLTAPVDRQQPPISRLALQLHAARADLQAAFPDVRGAHRQAYMAWFAERAGLEAKIVPALMGSAPAAAAARPAGNSNPGTAAHADPDPDRDAVAEPMHAAPDAQADPASTASGATRWHYRLAYRLAWNARHLLRPVVPLALRQRARSALIRRAFPPVAAAATSPNGRLASPTPDGLPFGVTVIGYAQAESGVGESARATLRALACTDVPHALVDFRVGNVSRMGEALDASLARDHRYAVSLFHINADQMPVARAHLDDAWFAARRRIGFWAWELEEFPATWHEAFEQVDEVWVPSAFCQAAVGAASPHPVLCMPHSIEIPQQMAPDRARFGLDAEAVIFLAMADMMSVSERKNPLGTVRAFCAAFEPGDRRAQLVVKVSNAARDAQAMARLQALAAAHPGVRLIADYLERPALNALMDSVDAYVSLHRSEGFGLGIAEAMARGKVAIATGWSGNMDFMTAHNALPVDFELVRLDADIGPYARGQRWAEPSIEDAARKMRDVVAHADWRRELGARARAHCRQHLAPEVIGARIAARLGTLARTAG